MVQAINPLPWPQWAKKAFRAAMAHARDENEWPRMARTGTINRCIPFAAVVSALLLLASAVRADEKDPIDAKLEACLTTDEGQTTAGMVGCTQAAIDAWDARLNENYRKAMAALDPKSRDLLQKAQRVWLAFRTAERAAEAGPWQRDRGSVVRVEVMGNELSAVKERAIELRLYMPAN